MNLSEKRRRRNVQEAVIKLFKMKYRTTKIGDIEFFASENGYFFIVSEFPGELALVIEYAGSVEEAEKRILEDGDRFYIDEKTDREIFEAMVREIEA